MKRYLKRYFWAACTFAALYFIIHSYLTVKINKRESVRKSPQMKITLSLKSNASQNPTPVKILKTAPLSTLKSNGSSNFLATKKSPNGNVLKPPKIVSKMKVTTKTQEKKGTPKTQDKKGIPKTQEKKGIPKTQNKKGTPKTQNKKGIPKTQEKKGIPKTQEKKGIPKTQNKEGTSKTQDKKVTPKTQNKKATPKMKITLSVKSNASLIDDRKFLAVLATTWLPEKEKEHVHENVAKNWGSWPGILQPVVYTNLSMTDKSFNQCIKSGWKFSSILNTRCEGVPVLKNMVINNMKNFPNSDFYGFVNSDILMDPGLIETFNFVKNHTKERPVFLIGRRTNVNFTKQLEIQSPMDVRQLAKKGNLMPAFAIDYFISDRSFPWGKLPDLVIGRYHYDNYMVYFGLMQKALVIDVTETVKAVHQTTEDGNDAGFSRHHTNCNKILIKSLGKFSVYWGFTSCTLNYTHRDKSGNIIMSSRKKRPKHFLQQKEMERKGLAENSD